MADALATRTSALGRLLPRRLPDRTTFLYAIYTIVLFFVFLIITFPHDLLVRSLAERIASQAGWRVQYEAVHLTPWGGYRFTDLKLLPSGDDDPWFTALHVGLRPTLSALARRQAFPLSFHGDAYGGSFSGVFDQGELSNLDLDWSDVDLANYPRVTKILEGNWGGHFTGEVHLSGKDALNTLDGRGHVTIKDASLTQGKAAGFTVPELHFSSGEGDFEMKAGKLELKSVKLSGTELDAELKGQVYLRAPAEQSLLNGTLTVKPVPGSPSGIEGLLTLLNRNQKPPGGVFSYQLYGTLSRVRIR